MPIEQVLLKRRALLSLLQEKHDKIRELIRSKASFDEWKPLFTEFRNIQKDFLKTFPFLYDNDEHFLDNDEQKNPPLLVDSNQV